MTQKSAVIIAAFLCAALLCTPALAASRVPEMELDVALRPDGAAHIIQTWTTDADEGTEFYLGCRDSGYLTITDFSAVVTGMLLAMNLPVSVPLWMPAVGAMFAIIVVKQLFGGLGKNFMNPALAARVFLFTAWPSHMTVFTKPGQRLSALAINADIPDTIVSATPLSTLKTGALSDTPIFDMLLGWTPGCIGEVSALLLAAGFVYLLIRKVITWKIPVIYIGVVLVYGYLAARSTLPFSYAASEALSGGLFLGAIFMATDYSTSPMTERGRAIYALGCGLLTIFIRRFGGYPEGVSFSILIMNLLVWYLDRYAKPVRFGGADSAKKQKQ